MTLGTLTPAIKHVIYNPRWRDRQVLIADFRIGTHNQIEFPKAKSLAGLWYISGREAKTYPVERMQTRAGGSIVMRVVPLDALQPLERGDAPQA